MTAPEPVTNALLLMLAFVLAGIAQTVWLKSTVSRRFSLPLDGGLRLRGRRILGENKTLRGFVVMVPVVGIVFFGLGLLRPHLPGVWQRGFWELSPPECAALGIWVGFWFMAGELPNSFLKRQLDVAEGDAPQHPVFKPLCFVLDQIDSILGALLALSLVVPTSPWVWGLLIVLGAAIHWGFNVVLYRLGVKARPA